MMKKLKPTIVNEMAVHEEKQMYKTKLLSKIQSNIRAGMKQKHEQIYDSITYKEVMLESLSVQYEY